MPASETTSPDPPDPREAQQRPPAVFLSYASDDRAVAERIAVSLRAAGLSVWFDAHQLQGGDTWDDEIRQRIKQCSFFVAIISPATESREEGYFRREWKLALERALDMADDRPFILPVAIGDIDLATARVPHRFLALQWTDSRNNPDPAPLVERLSALQRRAASRKTATYAQARPIAAPVAPHRSSWTTFSPTARLVVVLVLVLVALGVWKWRHAPAERSTGPTAAPNAVAVLPFVNVTGLAEDDYFTDGLTEELLTTLSREPGLSVVARTSSAAFKGKATTAQEIAAKLGASRLVEGTVRREAEILKVSIRLIAGGTGYGIWSRDYASPKSEILETEATIAADLAGQMLPAGSRASNRRALTGNVDAYDAFLRARSFQTKPATPGNLEAAANYYRQAVRFDPNFAAAWAKYAAVLIRSHDAGFDDRESSLATAHQAIRTALALEPDLPEAHYALAHYYTMNWTNQALAQKELLLALQGLPNDSDVRLSLAFSALYQGSFTTAIGYAHDALRLDPQNADTANICASLMDIASDYPEAVAERERAFRLGGWTGSIIEKAFVYRDWHGDLALTEKTLDGVAPAAGGGDAANEYWRAKVGLLRAEHRYPEALAAIDRIDTELLPLVFHYNSRSLLRAWVREELGDPAGARQNYLAALPGAERYRAANPRLVRAHTSLALIYAGLGREADARAEAQQCLTLIPPDDNPFIASFSGLRVLAQIEARFNHPDAALEIARAQAAKGMWKRYDLLLDPDFEWLRRDPRFVELAKTAPL